MQDGVTLDGCIQDSKERQNKAKKKLLEMSLPERVTGNIQETGPKSLLLLPTGFLM